jgi:hypothetical protein
MYANRTNGAFREDIPYCLSPEDKQTPRVTSRPNLHPEFHGKESRTAGAQETDVTRQKGQIHVRHRSRGRQHMLVLMQACAVEKFAILAAEEAMESERRGTKGLVIFFPMVAMILASDPN